MSFLQDLQFALRTLFKSKLVALVAIASLALIVAGNTVLFSVVNSLLIRPLSFDPEGRVMLAWRTELARTFDRRALSHADFNDYAQRNRVFEEVAGYESVRHNLTGTGEPEALDGARVTPSFFRALTVSLTHGRSFTEEEGRPGGDRVVVLSHEFFERRFAGDPAVLGESIDLDKQPHRIVGVMEKDFSFVDLDLDVYLPLALDPASIDREDTVIWPFIGKLREGMTRDRAQEDMAAIATDLAARYPEANRGMGIEVSDFRQLIPGPEDAQLFKMMQGAGIFLLLIACANLANLLLARGQVRQRELALRAAIGATRGRLVRQLVTESVVLALIGGALGLGLGYAGVEVMRNALGADIPPSYLPVLDQRVLAFSIVLSAFAGLVFGTFPALRSAGADLTENLKEGGRSNAASSRGWTRRGLVVAQVTLALVVLCGIGLLLKTMASAHYADPGFDDDGLLTFMVTLPEQDYEDDARCVAFFEQLHQELEALPGAADATLIGGFPRSFQVPVAEVEDPDAPIAEGEPRPAASNQPVTPGFFDMMGISLMRGRDFTLADNAEATLVAIVDRSFAESFWPGEDPVGRRVSVDDRVHVVVGMAPDIMMRRLPAVEGSLNDTVYTPWAQEEERRTARVMIRSSSGDPMALASAARHAVGALDPDLPLSEVRSYDDVLASIYIGITVFGNLLAAFALVALLLAALGVYGVLAFSVTQRTQEIGVRVALGASRFQVLGMVLRDGLVLAAVGVGLGLPVVWWVTNMLNAALAGIAEGWLVFVPLIVAVLLGVILVASLAPARRAAALSPVQALRAD